MRKESQIQLDYSRNQLATEGIILITKRYYRFGLKALLHWIPYLLSLWKLCWSKKITHIHTWCTPAGGIGYFLSILTGKPLILDSYEAHAEAMTESKNWKENGIAFKTLFWLEKKQSQRASKIITTSLSMGEYAAEKYGLSLPTLHMKPACIDLSAFSMENRKKPDLLKKLNLNNKIVCVYAGKFGGFYLENEVFDFFIACRDQWPNRFSVLLLTSHSQEDIEKYCNEAGFPCELIIRKFVPHSQIPDYIGLGDFAIAPVKPIPTKRHGSLIKTGEYWALGLPVVITAGISGDSEKIEKNNIGTVIKSLDTKGYQNATSEIANLLGLYTSEQLYDKIRPFAEKYRNFEIAEKVYHKIYSH